ncbi:MAG: hypothetical protein RBR49_12465 [Desulfovibrio desulfuricans]|jgi:hypothetical protein|nr:hypothetical protein [Desulfovibrio desulfuricans]
MTLDEISLFNSTFGIFDKTAYEVLLGWYLSPDTGRFFATVMIGCALASWATIVLLHALLLIVDYRQVTGTKPASVLLTLFAGVTSRYLALPLWLFYCVATYLVFILREMLGYGS